MVMARGWLRARETTRRAALPHRNGRERYHVVEPDAIQKALEQADEREGWAAKLLRTRTAMGFFKVALCQQGGNRGFLLPSELCAVAPHPDST